MKPIGKYVMRMSWKERRHRRLIVLCMNGVRRAQGKGIFLFTKLSQISDWRTDYRWRPENQQVETYVVQKYISNPYLVGGKKVLQCLVSPHPIRQLSYNRPTAHICLWTTKPN